MRRLVVVFIGGGLGSVLRAALLAWLAGGGTSAVLLANLLGAFALGIVYVLADEAGLLRPPTRFFLAVGVLGGFTTFSTFIWGANLLVTRLTWGAAVNYLVASVGGGVVAVIAGLSAGRELAQLNALGLRRARGHADAVDTIETEDRQHTRPATEGDHQEPA
jgi:CrcB protein